MTQSPQSDPLVQLGRAAARLKLDNLPAEVVQRAKQRVLDTVGCLVAGYEVEIRFGRAVFPSAFYRGWWTPGLFGGIGSAVSTGHVLGLDGPGLDNTIGIALNMLPTAMGRANEEGETIKWLLGGQSCAAGVLAAEMAARGVKGMRDVIKGWLPVVADEVHAERLTEGILDDGSFRQWELLSGVLTKHYATVGPLTASLDATFDLVARNDIAADDIREIEVECMRRTAIFNTRHPENGVAARASLPYCLAVAVCRKDPGLLLGPAFHDDVLKDRAVWAAADKVKIKENEGYERQYPARSLARVTIRLHNGKSFTQEEDRSARGRYLTPTDEEIEHKFALIARPVLGAAKADKVVALVRRLESLPHAGELVAALKP